MGEVEEARGLGEGMTAAGSSPKSGEEVRQAGWLDWIERGGQQRVALAECSWTKTPQPRPPYGRRRAPTRALSARHLCLSHPRTAPPPGCWCLLHAAARAAAAAAASRALVRCSASHQPRCGGPPCRIETHQAALAAPVGQASLQATPGVAKPRSRRFLGAHRLRRVWRRERRRRALRGSSTPARGCSAAPALAGIIPAASEAPDAPHPYPGRFFPRAVDDDPGEANQREESEKSHQNRPPRPPPRRYLVPHSTPLHQ